MVFPLRVCDNLDREAGVRQAVVLHLGILRDEIYPLAKAKTSF